MGKIYKLECSDGSFYIGSTMGTLEERLRLHKLQSKKTKSKVYTHINSIGWDSVKISLIEECDDDSRRQREDELIKEALQDSMCLNSNRASITAEEKSQRQKAYDAARKELRKAYLAANKEKIAERMRRYREQHRDEIAEYHRQYMKTKTIEKEVEN